MVNMCHNRKMNRIAFVVHYDSGTITNKYVFYLLNKIRPVYDYVFFVSNCNLNKQDHDEISNIVDSVLVRENSGFDFAAWSEAIVQFGWKNLDRYDSVTLLNTSCFGPIFPLDTIYETFENNHDVDFWGITNFSESKNVDWYPGGTIPEHIQSYFICIKNNVVESGHFKSFFEKVRSSATRDEVVYQYETRFTQYLQEKGFNYQCIFDTARDSIDRGYVDYSRYGPDLCIDMGAPFIKIKAFLPEYNRTPYKTLQHISRISSYPIELIKDYFHHTSNKTAHALRVNAIQYIATRLTRSREDN